MELTRHLTATVYVVVDGAVALHEHERHDVVVPPGGHVDRGELPHEAGLREVREETGLEATLLDDGETVAGDAPRTLPRARHHLLYDVNVHDGEVGHQHVDLIYYATATMREIRPAEGEAASGAWDWYTASDLRAGDVDDDVAYLALEAVEAAAKNGA